MSGLTSNANLTGYRYGNGSTVGEQFPNVPIKAAPTGAQTVTLNLLSNTSTIYNPTVVPGEVFISLNQIASTTTVYNPTVVQTGGSQTITLDLLSNTSSVYNPTVLPGAVTINLDQIVSTTTVYNPTVVQPGGAQTIALDLLASTTQVFNPIVSLISLVTDTSDILDRGLKRRGLTAKEEENIAAQLLLQRQKKNLPAIKKKLINWKQLLFEQINGVTTIEELDAIEIPTIVTESVEVTAAILAEIERQKELKRLELQIKKQELEVKQQQIAELVSQQKKALKAAKALYKDVLARHKLAMDQAIQIEQKAALMAWEAEQKAAEFNRKREQRIKRLKALMWLAKLDL